MRPPTLPFGSLGPVLLQEDAILPEPLSPRDPCHRGNLYRRIQPEGCASSGLPELEHDRDVYVADLAKHVHADVVRMALKG